MERNTGVRFLNPHYSYRFVAKSAFARQASESTIAAELFMSNAG
jgi:hypothetical protein